VTGAHSAAGRRRPARARRRDVEGLRAVAIAAVVVYHARPRLLPGGYVGVDVFFVVSGFLITSILWRELEEGGRISFRRFYAARARRLLPSAALVIAATVVASAILLSPLRLPSIARDGVASALYAANYRFALASTSYLTAAGPPSPFLHYWSLGVEEQFYVLWPAFLLAVSLLWWRRRRAGGDGGGVPSRSTAFVATVVLWAASFAACWYLTARNQPWAFYALPPRAFELASGGLVALAARPLARLPRPAGALLSWVGLALIVASCLRFGAGTPFPGSAALAPVLGTAAVIAAGQRRAEAGLAGLTTGAAIVLERAPMQWLGAVSYTLYLWHWPVLVLLPSALGHRLHPYQPLLAVAGSLVLAAATTLLVERPVRFSPSLSLRPVYGLVSGAALSLGAASAAVLVASALPTLHGSGTVHVASLADAADGHLLAGTRSAPRLSPLELKAAAVDAAVQTQVAASLGHRPVPADVSPPLYQADLDEAAPFWDGCFDNFTDVTVHPCDYGDPGGKRSVVLFGDSHAFMWFPAVAAVASAHHDRLVALAKATCPPLELEVFSPDLDEWYSACDQWRGAVLARIAALHPQVVVLGFSREYGVGNDHVLVYGRAWLHGLQAMVRLLRRDGAEVVVIGPVPYPPWVVPDCLAGHLGDASYCRMNDRAPWYNGAGVRAEEAAVAAAGGSYIDVHPWFCAKGSCATLVGNMIVYRDDNHLSKTYATWLAPAMSAALAAATDGRL